MNDAPRPDIPEAGFYRRRLVKAGCWVAVRIEYMVAKDPLTGEQLDRSPIWRAWCNGEEVDVFDVWPECSGEPIPESEYHHLLSVKEWAEQNDRTAPEANPRKAINMNSMPPIKFAKGDANAR